MTPEQLVVQLLSPGADFAAAYDGLVAAGAAAVPALTAAIARGRAVPALTAVLSALRLDDAVAVYAPLVLEFDDVQDAGLRALGATGDPRALPLLVEALPAARFVAAEALGVLGRPEAVAPLRDLVRPRVGDGSRLPEASELRASSSCLELRLVCTVASALGRLGDHALAPVAIRLASLRDDNEASTASQVRAAAVAALHDAVAPGVAAALRAASADPDLDTARAALLGTLYLGRIDEVATWLAVLSAGGDTAANAAWCLAQWSGDALDRQRDGSLAAATAERWWASASQRFTRGVCYRHGAPVDAVRVAAALPGDPRTVRGELRVRFAAPADPLLAGNPASPGEQAALAAWAAANAARFPAGRLHRGGRSYDPGAVDG